LTIEDFEAYLD